MSVRSRTVRRLSILLAGLGVLVAIGAGLYFHNEHVKAARLAAARQAGMTAFAAGDYRAALEALKGYIAKNRQDNQALYAYGVARSRIEEPNGRNIAEGITVFTALLQQDPGNTAAMYDLLDLYTQAFYNSEAVELSDRILARSPDDPRALKAKCIALDRQHKGEAALAISRKLNDLQPGDFEQQLTTMQLMRSLGNPAAAWIARAEQLMAAHRGDPRFELLAALAHGWSGDAAAGQKLLRQAATRPAPDATYVRYMVRVLDSQKMYQDAHNVLDRAAAQNRNDPAIMRLLVQRLWQGRRFDQVLQRLGDLDPKTGDTDLLAYRAMALFQTGKTEPARQILSALSHRADAAAIAWSAALPAWFDHVDPKAALEKYRTAVDRAPENAVIRYLIGQAYAQLGERDLAVQSWRRAAELSPSWAAPHVDAARALAAAGRIREAVAEGQLALVAAPDSPEVAVTAASVQYMALEQGQFDTAREPALLELVRQIQQVVPGEEQTLPIYLSLLARAGHKDQAIAAAHQVLAATTQPTQSTLLRLISVSRAQGLGLEADLQRALSTASPGSDGPRVALERASDLAAAGKPQDGLALIESSAAGATTQPVQWDLARLEYKEMIHDPSAAAQWIRLGDAHADDLAVQTAILKSATSARTDRDFIARTIDRLKNLTGPDGQTWKIERARWLIGSDSSKDAAEAVNTLTEIVRNSPRLGKARALLSRAYENVGNTPAAAREMQAASDLEPASANLALETARLMQAQNQFAEARPYIDRAVASPELTSEGRHRAAGMLAGQGELAPAIKVLRDAGDHLDLSGKLLLAQLLRRQNQIGEAEGIYAALLQAHPVPVEAIAAVADFDASQGKLEQARAVLSRLTEAPPGVAEVLRGDFDERHGAPADAAREFAAATQAAPADPNTWRALVAYHFRGERYPQAAAAAKSGAGQTGDAGLKQLASIAATLESLSQQNPTWQTALAVLAAAASNDRAALDLLANWNASTETGDPLLARLNHAIDRAPRSLALRQALVQLQLARKDLDQAGKAAAAMMQAFPADADSCRIAATIYQAAGRYDLAAAAARQWRQLTLSDPKTADRALAEIRLADGNAPGALQALSPYVKDAAAHPDANAALLATFLRAQVLTGQFADARKTLEPLLSATPRWRELWMNLAGDDMASGDTAADWLNHVAPLIAGPTEQTALATAWYHLAVRTGSAPAAAKAVQLLDPIVKLPTAPAGPVLLRAALAQRDGDAKSAEALYRRGLGLVPDQPEALNNLAYLLYARGGDLKEANDLATRAVAISPKSANFYDTLARIEARQGKRDSAVEHFRQAIKLEPNNLEALVGLATTLCDAGQRSAAGDLIPRIDTIAKSRTVLPTHLHTELETLHNAIKSSL